MEVHPTAVLDESEGPIEIGEGTTIGPFCYIKGPARIGRQNKIFPHCIIGTEGEHKRASPVGSMVIGDNNVIRENFVMQRGTGNRDTQVGNSCFIMDRCHVGHDVLISDGVTIAPNASLGGHMVILEGATIGMASASHQHSVVGAYAMVGMAAAVTKDVPPFCLVRGNPAIFGRLNTHTFEKLGIGEEDLELISGQGASETPYILYKSERVNQFVAEFRRYCSRPKTVIAIEQQGLSS